MRQVSTASLVRQITREGGRLHLFPLVEDGKCFVAQEQKVYAGGAGIGHIRREKVAVCSIDMAHPLSTVARFRRRRWEHDRMKLYREAAARRRAALLASFEPRRHELVSDAKKMVRQLGADALWQVTAEVFGARPHSR
jgi:hypothetical protein